MLKIKDNTLSKWEKLVDKEIKQLEQAGIVEKIEEQEDIMKDFQKLVFLRRKKSIDNLLYKKKIK